MQVRYLQIAVLIYLAVGAVLGAVCRNHWQRCVVVRQVDTMDSYYEECLLKRTSWAMQIFFSELAPGTWEYPDIPGKALAIVLFWPFYLLRFMLRTWTDAHRRQPDAFRPDEGIKAMEDLRDQLWAECSVHRSKANSLEASIRELDKCIETRRANEQGHAVYRSSPKHDSH